MRIHILTNALDYGDAVSTHCVLLQQRARELSIPASLYAEYSHPSLADQCAPLESLLQEATADDILIHQLFNETALIPFLEQFPGKRVMMYHNITPARYFAKGSPAFESCSRGLRLAKTLAPHYDLALGMSEFSRQELERMGYTRTGVFPLLMNLPSSSRMRTVTQPRKGASTFLFVGRIAPNKGIENLLRFLSAYKGKVKSATLTLVGNDNQHPDYKQRLVEEAARVGLEVGRDVEFRGKVSDAERDLAYHSSDAFICLSEHEGFCAPLIESMAAGLPTFCLDRAACAETMGGAGVVLPNLDFPAIAATVADVLGRSSRRAEVLRTQQKRLTDFSPQNQRAVLKELLREVSSLPPAERPKPAVSVVINTYNRGWHLDRCLRALQQQTWKSFEVVVVNGPSTDDTESRLKSWEGTLRLVLTSSRVLSVSRNLGIAASRGEIVAFIDDDAVPNQNWLAELIPAFADPGVGGAGGLVYRMNGRDVEFRNGILDRKGWVRWDEPLPGFHFDWEEGYLNTVSGNNCAFRRSALCHIGGFDERIEYYHDEADVVMRLALAGFRTVHRPRAVVYHEAARSHNRTSRHNLAWYAVLKNTLYVALKNYRGPSRAELASQIVRHLIEHRLRPPLRWRRDREVTFGELARIEGHCIRGIAVGLIRGFLADSRPGQLMEPIGSLEEFPREESAPLAVCLLTQNLPEQAPGGIATYTAALAKGLRGLGIEVHVVSRGAASGKPDRRDGIWYRQAGEDPLDVELPENVPTVAKNLLYANGVRRKLQEILTARRLDLVESPSWDVEGLLLAMERRLPVVVRWHSPLFKVMETQGWQPTSDLETCCQLEALWTRHGSAVSGSTEGILSTIAERYGVVPEWTARIPLGLDFEPMDNVTPRVNGHTASLRLLFVGRLERRKGIHTLLDALPAVLTRLPNVVVEIVGSDPGNPGHGYWHERWGAMHPTLRSRVHFHGECSGQQLRQFYQDCDLFVAPSLYESFGLIYLEAMAYGKAVIGTEAGGIPEVVAHGETGLLVPPGDPDALGAAMVRLMEDHALRRRYGAAGRKRFELEFSAQAMAERTLAFYRDVHQGWRSANPPVWTGRPLDAFRAPSTSITWMPESSHLWLTAPKGAAETIWWGPYIALEEGMYRVEFVIRAEPPASAEEAIAIVDAFNIEAGYIEQHTLHGRDLHGGMAIADVFFRVPAQAGGKYEFRVHTSGAVDIGVREIVVRTWPPKPAALPAQPPAWAWTPKRSPLRSALG